MKTATAAKSNHECPYCLGDGYIIKNTGWRGKGWGDTEPIEIYGQCNICKGRGKITFNEYKIFMGDDLEISDIT